MRAMVIRAFGGPEVFELRELPRPEPGPSELLVRVRATSINPVDYKIRQAGSWAGITPPAIIGYDAAGIVEAVGSNVKRFKPGDEVFYTPEIFGKQGTYAEYNTVDEGIVAKKPASLSFEEAASLPLAGGTAWDAIHARAAVRLGETVLIHAGAGGVGSLAVQMAKGAGARVLATCRSDNAALVRELGADETIDYKADDFVAAVRRLTGQAGCDVVFDTVGGETVAKSIEVTKPHGRLVSIVSAQGSLGGAYIKNLTLHFEFLERAAHKVEALAHLVEQGKLRPVIDSVLPLEKVAEAHARVEAGGVRGKVVLAI